MADNRWIGKADAVAQVSTGSIDSVDATPANNTFTVTIGGVAISQAGTVDVATTAAALLVKLNASTHPYFAAITWTNPSAGNIVGTADVAGVPFVAALTETGAGTGAVTDFASTTANAGPNDWNTAANWSLAAVPVATNVVILENSDDDIFWGLSQAGATFAELRIMQSFTGRIGLPEDRFTTGTPNNDSVSSTEKPEYRTTHLTVDSTLVNIGQVVGLGFPAGSTRLKINLGTVQTAVTVYNTANTSADAGMQPLRVKGTHASNTLKLYSGVVGVGTTYGGEAATFVTTNQLGGNLTLGSSVTWTTINKTGGSLVVRSASTSGAIYNNDGDLSVTVTSGTIGTIQNIGNAVLNGAFAITNLYPVGGTTISNTTGTISGATIDNGGVLDFSKANAARTVSAINFGQGGGVLVADLGYMTFTAGAPGATIYGPFRIEVKSGA